MPKGQTHIPTLISLPVLAKKKKTSEKETNWPDVEFHVSCLQSQRQISRQKKRFRQTAEKSVMLNLKDLVSS
jgi:hypothetical protein